MVPRVTAKGGIEWVQEGGSERGGDGGGEMRGGWGGALGSGEGRSAWGGEKGSERGSERAHDVRSGGWVHQEQASVSGQSVVGSSGSVSVSYKPGPDSGPLLLSASAWRRLGDWLMARAGLVDRITGKEIDMGGGRGGAAEGVGRGFGEEWRRHVEEMGVLPEIPGEVRGVSIVGYRCCIVG